MPVKKRTAGLDWEDVRYFVALARRGTLSATARDLRVNHATVARRGAGLEAAVGHPLFDRRADGYALTADGKAVLDEARAMDEAALSVLRRLDAGTELNGLVRLAIGRVLAERFLIDRLRAFHARYPAIDLEIIGGSRVVSLARREADLALRYGSPKDSDLIARRVATIGFGLYAAPGYRDKIDAGRRRRSLASTTRAITSRKPPGSRSNSASGGFRCAPTARPRRPPPRAPASASRCFPATSPPPTRTSCRCRSPRGCRNARHGRSSRATCAT